MIEIFLPFAVGLLAISWVSLAAFIFDEYFSHVAVWLFLTFLVVGAAAVVHMVGFVIVKRWG